MKDTTFESFALVELFGHTRIAGKVTEQTVGSATFIRVDVPETKTQPAFTRLLNPSAIYAINPITEQVATAMATNLDKAPIQAWDIREVVEKERVRLGMPAENEEDHY